MCCLYCLFSHRLPKPIISEGKWPDWVHRNCAGNRFSDRLTSLLVFQAWDDARYKICLEVTANSCVTGLDMSLAALTARSSLFFLNGLLIQSVCVLEWVVKKQEKDFVNTKDLAWLCLRMTWKAIVQLKGTNSVFLEGEILRGHSDL